MYKHCVNISGEERDKNRCINLCAVKHDEFEEQYN
jgi:hypothetical protein